MSGMHSAIIDYHKQHKLSIRESTKLEIKQFLSERCAATTDEIFRQGLNRLINKIESEMTMLGKRVNQERRYGEMLFTTFYKDLKYLN
jgi:hypothetical protein